MSHTLPALISRTLGLRTATVIDSAGSRPLTPAEQLELLTAFALVPTDTDSLETAVGLLRQRQAAQVLPPVLVAAEGAAAITVPLRWPAHLAEEQVHWQIFVEQGGTREGSLRPVELDPLPGVDEGEEAPLGLVLEPGLEPGYHRLEVRAAGGDSEPIQADCTLIVVPPECFTPPGLEQDGRVWGLGCDLAAVRSRRNWGCGDLSDLLTLLDWAAQTGAGTVALRPLHRPQSGTDGPEQPLLPSDPAFPDPLFLDLEAIADFQESEQARNLVASPAFQVRLAQLRDTAETARDEVAVLKEEVGQILWRHFQDNHLDPDSGRGSDFRRFQAAGGDRLAAFAGQHGEQSEYHQYLQWQLDLQLAAAGRRSMELGLKVGITLTLPAGIDPHGAAVQHQPDLFAESLAVHGCAEGADGCACGPPVRRHRLREQAYRPFIAWLRGQMRHNGALCLDDIDLLAGQVWHWREREDAPAMQVTPDSDDLLGILALESRRNRCLIIGEHHRPLPADFAGPLDRRAILRFDPGTFCKDAEGGWLAPGRYPAGAVVSASRGTACTLAGYWQGADIALRVACSPAFDERQRETAIIGRASERARMLVALRHADLLPPGHDLDPAAVPSLTPALIRAVHLFLVRTPARLLLVQLADLMDLAADALPPVQTRLTAASRPIDLARLMADEGLHELFRDFCVERSLGAVRPSALPGERRRQAERAMPRAFYRIQFNRDCTFLQVTEHLPYLRELGISHCYASPYLTARPGSGHGYDIIDHSRLNPEIGTRKEYERFVAGLEENHLAQILDMVPNHMGVGPDNRWWLDVLENGQASPYADFFDINWQPQEEELQNRILLPVLGNAFGVVLEEGHLRLVFEPDHGRFLLACYDQHYPIAPRSYPHVLGHDLERLEARLGARHEGFLELQNLIASFTGLPGREEDDPEQVAMRDRNKEVLKRLLARLCREVPEIGQFIEENVLLCNGEPGRPESFDLLEQLLALQAYRLAFWRVASDEINYRRFFDINELAGLRMDRREVFTETHRLVLDLIATGRIDGLRIDHPDGLYDPEGYFRTLQTAVSGVSPEQGPLPLPAAGTARDWQEHLPLYLVVEKILCAGEELPDNWLVHGTTGYEFSCLLNGIFVDRTSEQAMTHLYHRFIGHPLDCTELAHDTRRLIIRTAMAGEINVLSTLLLRLAKRSRYTRDFTLNGLRDALTEVIACFPVYRTYCTDAGHSETDRQRVEQAVQAARGRWQAEDTSIYDFIRAVLLLTPGPRGLDQDRQALDFVRKFQQYTGPVMAKGLEDTAFYIYNRLVSLNEVGDEPHRFGVAVDDFHAANRMRAERWPHAMLNTSTHDSKRSEDVRARIDVLSEMVPAWEQAVDRWHRLNADRKTRVGGKPAPSRNDEYALYQNLLGIWPLTEVDEAGLERLRQRFTEYTLKAVREAKVHTSWLNRNQAYEDAITAFIEQLLDPADRAFVDDFAAFARTVARFGLFNSLGQLLVKLTAPGIPDTYQGSEVWQFRLVDPDNRHPVDWHDLGERFRSLQELLAGDDPPLAERLGALLDHPADGRVKMYTLWRTLGWRREHEQLFARGSYLPLRAQGSAADHLFAFARVHRQHTAVVCVPRLVARLQETTGERLALDPERLAETTLELPGHLAGRQVHNLFSGTGFTVPVQHSSALRAADLFRHFPVALLVADEAPS